MEIVILRNDRSLLINKYSEFSGGRAENYEDVMHVRNALQKIGLQPGEFVVKDDLSNLKKLKEINPALVFNLCDDFLDPEKEALVPKKLDNMGIPYTGDSFTALKVCTQKELSKKKLVEFGVTTPKYMLINSVKTMVNGLKFPLIVKPTEEHGSIGIQQDSVVYNQEQLREKLNDMLEKYGEMLVEEYIEGRELSTVVIGDQVMKVSEIMFDESFEGKPTIMTYDAKWLDDTQEYKGTVRKTPAKLTKELEDRVKEESVKAYKALGCRSYARVDLRLDKNGTPYVLEVNVNPDLSRGGAVAKIAQASRISYPKLIKAIVENAKQSMEEEAAKIENKEVTSN